MLLIIRNFVLILFGAFDHLIFVQTIHLHSSSWSFSNGYWRVLVWNLWLIYLWAELGMRSGSSGNPSTLRSELHNYLFKCRFICFCMINLELQHVFYLLTLMYRVLLPNNLIVHMFYSVLRLSMIIVRLLIRMVILDYSLCTVFLVWFYIQQQVYEKSFIDKPPNNLPCKGILVVIYAKEYMLALNPWEIWYCAPVWINLINSYFS